MSRRYTYVWMPTRGGTPVGPFSEILHLERWVERNSMTADYTILVVENPDEVKPAKVVPLFGGRREPTPGGAA